VRQAFGSFIAEKDGVNVCVKCPKCGKQGSQKKKLVIKIDDGKFHCWVCGLKGTNIMYLFRKYAPAHASKVSDVFGSSKSTLFSIDSEEDEQNIDLSKDLDGFVFLGDVKQNSDPDLKDVVRYARKRGITTSMMWRYRLGACTLGQMRRRLIIPSFDRSGVLNFYSAREIDGTSRMKYINAPIPKKEVIFNEIMIDWTKPIILVEGPLDAIIGGQNVICLLGSHLSEDSEVFKQIIKSNSTVYMSLDHDAKKNSEKISKMLSSFDIKVMEIALPEDKDVADLGREKFKKLVEEATAWSQEKRLLRMISSIKTGSLI